MNSSSRPPPPKPWERKGSTQEPFEVSNTVANGANLSNTPIPDANTSPSSTISPRAPPRPTNLTSSYDRFGNSYGSRAPYYGGNSSYSNLNNYSNRYGNYGYSNFGNRYGLGSNYSTYGMGSGYGTYGSAYGSTYGSNYGSLGNRYGPYSYGGIGPYGNRFSNDMPGRDGLFRNVLDNGYGKLRGFGDIVEGFSRFSHLLDANFEAVHGSFSSIIRLIDVFGEFTLVIKSFWLIRVVMSIIYKFWRTFAWILGRDFGRKTNDPSSLVGDYVKVENERRRKKILPMLFILIGAAILSAPMILTKFFKIIRDFRSLEQLESIWREPVIGEESTQFRIVRALHDFQGSNEMDLTFRKNDMIKLLGTPYPDWWEGEINGKRGFFPAQFVQPIEGESPRVAEYQDPENLPS